jgi:hypothetical protein
METQEILNSINNIVNDIRNYLLPITLTATAVGTLSMALIQTLKDMLSLRMHYQKYWLRKWIKQQLNELKVSGYLKRSIELSKLADQNTYDVTRKIETHLLKLAMNGSSTGFYGLPIEQLCGQINGAVQQCLDYPSKNEDLLSIFTTQVDVDDWQKFITPDSILKDASNSLKEDPVHIEKQTEYIDARNRINNQIQRAIDSIQISAGNSWQYILQVSSIVLSALICFIGICCAGNISYLVIIPVSILGGFLAPVARDLFAALQNLRTK